MISGNNELPLEGRLQIVIVDGSGRKSFLPFLHRLSESEGEAKTFDVLVDLGNLHHLVVFGLVGAGISSPLIQPRYGNFEIFWERCLHDSLDTWFWVLFL